MSTDSYCSRWFSAVFYVLNNLSIAHIHDFWYFHANCLWKTITLCQSLKVKWFHLPSSYWISRVSGVLNPNVFSLSWCSSQQVTWALPELLGLSTSYPHQLVTCSRVASMPQVDQIWWAYSMLAYFLLPIFEQWVEKHAVFFKNFSFLLLTRNSSENYVFFFFNFFLPSSSISTTNSVEYSCNSFTTKCYIQLWFLLFFPSQQTKISPSRVSITYHEGNHPCTFHGASWR